MSSERTYFSGVKLNRLCEERSNPESEKKFIEDPSALCILFNKFSFAVFENKELYKSNLHKEALNIIDRDTLTFLGVQLNENKTPIFVAQIQEPKIPTLPPNISFELSLNATLPFTPDEAALTGYAKSMVRQHVVATFCPICGSKTVPQWIGTKRFCAKCNQDIFTRTDPVWIITVVHPTDPRKVLLVHKIGFPNLFHSCVAGFIEPGETAEEATCREVMEETGVLVDISTLKFVGTQPWPANIGSQLMIGFIGRAKTEDITIDPSEIDHAQWYTDVEVRKAIEGDKEVNDNILTLPVTIGIATKMLRVWLESL